MDMEEHNRLRAGRSCATCALFKPSDKPTMPYVQGWCGYQAPPIFQNILWKDRADTGIRHAESDWCHEWTPDLVRITENNS